MTEIANLKLEPELIKLYQILKEINAKERQCDYFSPLASLSTEESRNEFDEIVLLLREAKRREYINDLIEHPGGLIGIVRSITVIGGLTFKGRQVLNNPEKLKFENHPTGFVDMSNNITINSSTVHGSIVAAKHIQKSFNSLSTSKTDDEVKELLVQLLAEIKALNDKVPEQQFVDMAEGAETLISEASRNQPRKKWYEASLEGIKEAALTVGGVAAPVMAVVEKLVPLLLV